MADALKDYIQKVEKELSKIPQFQIIEQKTGIPKAYLVAGSFFFVFLLILLNIGGALITHLVGFLYPAYASFKAIESSSKEDDTLWLTYWTTFGFLSIAEFFSDIILYWVPFYYTFKFIFILYLMLPQTKGSAVLYTRFLRPYLIKDEASIDSGIAKLKSKVNATLQEVAADTGRPASTKVD